MIESVRTLVRSHFVALLAGVAVLGLVVRVVYVFTVAEHIPMGIDAAWYVVEGHALGHGHGYVDPRLWLLHAEFSPTANFPPLWPVLLSVADRVGLRSNVQNQLVGTVVGTATVVVTGVLGRRVAGPGVGVVAAVFVACSPMLIAADGSFMAESLYVLLIASTLVAAYAALGRPSTWRFAVVGLLVGLAALTRSDALFLTPILLVTLIWRVRGPSPRRRGCLAAGFVVAAAIPIGAWTVYSSVRMDALVVTTSNSGNMLTGANCPSTYSGPLLGAWDARCASDLAPGADEVAWAERARSRGLDYARDHATRLPLVATARVLRTFGLWDPVATARLEQVETRNEHWQLVGWGYDLVLLAAAGAGAVVAARRRLVVAPMAAVLVGVVVTAALSNGNQRFRLAADPILAIGAALVVVTFVAGRAVAGRSGPDGPRTDGDRPASTRVDTTGPDSGAVPAVGS